MKYTFTVLHCKAKKEKESQIGNKDFLKVVFVPNEGTCQINKLIKSYYTTKVVLYANNVSEESKEVIEKQLQPQPKLKIFQHAIKDLEKEDLCFESTWIAYTLLKSLPKKRGYKSRKGEDYCPSSDKRYAKNVKRINDTRKQREKKNPELAARNKKFDKIRKTETAKVKNKFK